MNTWLALATLCFVASVAASAYSGLRIVAPQLTSENYKDLRSGRLQPPPIITIVAAEGSKIDYETYRQSQRQAYMSRELDIERSAGIRGLRFWGSISILIGGLGIWRWRVLRRQPGAV